MTAEELFENYKDYTALAENHYDYLVDKEDFKKALIEFAKYHVEQALKAASSEVSTTKLDWEDYYDFSLGVKTVSNEDEIQGVLNAYPLENIK